MNGSQSYAERNKAPNKGEILFEKYCKDKQVQCVRLGFDEKNNAIPNFHLINTLLRNIPDYFVATNSRQFLVMVKGTANIKKKEVAMIPLFMEWYATKDVPLYYAFCFEGQNTPTFRTPDQVITLYQEGQDKQWSDGVIYRTLQL